MRYDYLIVGAGAAGCALAARLSEDPAAEVLLLERGSASRGPATSIPRAFPAALRPPLLDSYPTSEPDGTTGYWVRGRGLGGSTLVNGMMYLRGEPEGYDTLADTAGPGWGWSAFRRAFDEIECRFVHPSLAPLNPLAARIAAAFAHLSAHSVTDLNRASGARVGVTPATIGNGARVTAASAFLRPLRDRPNLTVLSGVTVDRLVWNGSDVTGVVARRGAEQGEIRARTVVLCAGTIETPLLLERSGVGDPDLLRECGIDVRVAHPRVGEGVREQRGAGLQLRLRDGVEGADELLGRRSWAREALRYAITRGGALARPAYDLTALLPSGGSGSVDAQAMALPFGLASGGRLRPAEHPAVYLTAYPLRPTSAGSVHLDPAFPSRTAAIQARYDMTETDSAARQRVADLLRAVAGSPPLQEVVIGEDSETGLTAASVYHAVGSAAMGADEASVTDRDLRVRGTEGLRVADLSVLPFHTSGSTAAPAMALGWLAGELLLGDA